MVKKLVLLTSSANSLINFRFDFIKLCIEKGVAVIALAPDYDETTKNALNDIGCSTVPYKCKRTGMNPLVDLYHAIKLIFILKNLKPDYLLAYFIKPVTYGIIASSFVRIGKRFALIEGLGFLFTQDNNYKKISRYLIRILVIALYKISIRKCDRVLFLNDDDAKFFVDKKICKENKIEVLGGIGVDLNEWPQVRPNIINIKFLYIGRLLKSKGVFEFIEAARIVKKCYPNATFVILGAADNNPDSVDTDYIKNAVQNHIIVWPGHVKVRDWISKSSVFVLPSYYREGVPRSTQEAMATGLPVITTDSPGCKDTVIDNVTGFIVRTKCPASIAEKMEYFLNNPNKITEMGIEGRKYAEIHFDSIKQSKKLYSFIFE